MKGSKISKVKIQCVQLEEKKGTRKWNRKSFVFVEINKLRKGTKARFHPIKFPICEMGLKKN